MEIMWKQLIQLERGVNKALQLQIREQIVSAIVSGVIRPNQSLPSSRELAKELNVARNTIVLAYEVLESEGYLKAISRKGYFVEENILCGSVQTSKHDKKGDIPTPEWCNNMLVKQPSKVRNILKCATWKEHEFPFIYGQLDPELIPINDWREAVKGTSTINEIRRWNIDQIDADDALLIEQIQSKVLPRRGIWANKEEILLTSGSQNAMYLAASLLVDKDSCVGIENPCYPDMKNTFLLKTDHLTPIDLDQHGLIVDNISDSCDLVYTTPSHQYPTGVTMSLERRKQLLTAAKEKKFVILEDDYEAEINFTAESTPSLKSIDKHNHVIYVGSFSKSFAPGLRLGYMVGPSEFIQEARALRRLMQRHIPVNNQRVVALFISLGHYHSMFHKIHTAYKERWHCMADAINTYPFLSFKTTEGGSAFWVEVPTSVDTKELCMRLLHKSVVIEPGDTFFLDETPPTNLIRLAYSSIPTHKIAQGIGLIAREVEKLMARKR